MIPSVYLVPSAWMDSVKSRNVDPIFLALRGWPVVKKEYAQVVMKRAVQRAFIVSEKSDVYLCQSA